MQAWAPPNGATVGARLITLVKASRISPARHHFPVVAHAAQVMAAAQRQDALAMLLRALDGFSMTTLPTCWPRPLWPS